MYVRLIFDDVFIEIRKNGERDILIRSFSYECKEMNVVKHSQCVINVTVDFS